MFGFDKLPRGLFLHSLLFQKIVSLAVTYKITGSYFHPFLHTYSGTHGCMVGGFEVLLTPVGCKPGFCYGKEMNPILRTTAKFVTDLVLSWNPMCPIESLFDNASKLSGCDKSELYTVVTNLCSPLVGDRLIKFFGFDSVHPPRDSAYERYCLESVRGWRDQVEEARV